MILKHITILIINWTCHSNITIITEHAEWDLNPHLKRCWWLPLNKNSAYFWKQLIRVPLRDWSHFDTSNLYSVFFSFDICQWFITKSLTMNHPAMKTSSTGRFFGWAMSAFTCQNRLSTSLTVIMHYAKRQESYFMGVICAPRHVCICLKTYTSVPYFKTSVALFYLKNSLWLSRLSYILIFPMLSGFCMVLSCLNLF